MHLKTGLNKELPRSSQCFFMQSGHSPASALSEDSEHVHVCNQFVTGFDGIIVDNGLHVLLTVESDARLVLEGVLPGADVQLARPDEQVLAPQVQVCRVVESQVAVHSDQLEDWRRARQVVDHVPPGFDVYVVALDWNRVVRPVRRVVPVPGPIFIGHILVQLLVAGANAPPTQLVDLILLVGVSRLVLAGKDEVSLSDGCLVVDNVLTKVVISEVGVLEVIGADWDGLIGYEVSSRSADTEVDLCSDICPVVNQINGLIPFFPSL